MNENKSTIDAESKNNNKKLLQEQNGAVHLPAHAAASSHRES